MGQGAAVAAQIGRTFQPLHIVHGLRAGLRHGDELALLLHHLLHLTAQRIHAGLQVGCLGCGQAVYGGVHPLKEPRVAQRAPGDHHAVTAGGLQQLHRILAEDAALVYHPYIFPLHALAFQTGDNAQAYLEPLIQNTMHFPVQPAEEDQARIADLLRRILTAAEQKAAGYELMIKAQLLQLIAELLRRKRFLAVPQSPRKKSQQLKQMLEYIQQHSESDLTIPTMAETFHLSEKYFSRYFRTATGQNFTAYLNTVRIEKARVLLRETDETVLEIALNCGYGSISYFNRVFRQQIGMSPLQYRTSAR